MVDELWNHWKARKQKKLPIIEFPNVWPKDLDGWKLGYVEKEPHVIKRKLEAYVEVDDDSDDEAGLLLADKGMAGTYHEWMYGDQSSHFQAKARPWMTRVREHRHQHSFPSHPPSNLAFQDSQTSLKKEVQWPMR